MKVDINGTEKLNTKEAAPIAGKSPPWLILGRRFGFGPDFIREGKGRGRIYYTRAAIDAWLASQKVGA